MTYPPSPEVHRPFKADDIGTTPLRLKFVTTDDERIAVADRLGLDALLSLDGQIELRKSLGRQYVVDGTIRADIRQTCVVTGAPVETSLTFSLRRVYEEDANPFDGLDTDEDEITPSIDDEDPDPLVDGQIDVGEAAVEELALQIPLYPRSDDAVFEYTETDSAQAETTNHPFAALQSLKNETKSDD